MAEEKVKEEQARLEYEKLANPSQEDLLKDIRDLLKAQNTVQKSEKETKKAE